MIFASTCVRIRQDIKDTCSLRQRKRVKNFTSKDLRYAEGGARILTGLHLFYGEEDVPMRQNGMKLIVRGRIMRVFAAYPAVALDESIPTKGKVI